jgi:hypothetical protein
MKRKHDICLENLVEPILSDSLHVKLTNEDKEILVSKPE